MGRAPRIEFAGAVYHIINRGNYRRSIFGTAGAARAFEACLFELCQELGWRLHAYVVMRNHFHLAAETPQPNLSKGMQWMESTFAKRFNRFRKEQGHLFQDRFKALLVEPGPSLLRLVNYIHLNPVRAGAVTVARLQHFQPCSFGRFLQPDRPAFLDCDRWLLELGLTDTSEGWANYAEILRLRSLEPKTNERFSRGWAIGSEVWRKGIARQYRNQLPLTRPKRKEWTALQATLWQNELERLLAEAGRTQAELAQARKGATWKIALAARLRTSTTASIPWLARALFMGSPNSLSVYLCRHKKIKD
jgi:putative transposase